MSLFHSDTFQLLKIRSQPSPATELEVQRTEQRIGFRLPASVRDWYCCDKAIEILEKHSNQNPPIPLEHFAVTAWSSHQLLPFQIENQGVCQWSILLDGSEDPPVYVNVNTQGTEWILCAPTFSAYVRACVWDYESVHHQPFLAEAQNIPLSADALQALERGFAVQPQTFGWPGSVACRFAGDLHAILICSWERGTDWFVGASDAISMESALKTIWNLDGVGKSLYDCSELARCVLARMRREAK